MSKREKPMKLEQFCVFIDEEKKVYYPGETFAGTLHVSLREQMMVAGISVTFCGQVKTCWHEGAGEEKKTFTGEEVLFRKSKVLFGNAPTSVEKRTMPGKPHKAGEFDYNFKFTFPQILPSSFESSFGSIRYYVKGQIHKPGIKLDFITKVPLTVIDRIDTTEMYCFTRKEDEILQTIGCFGIKSGPVFCKADIDRGCYIPGEYIVFNAHVENHSKKTLKGLKARLDQVVDYFAEDGSGHKISRKTLVRLKGPKVYPGETLEWSNQSLQIPITEPSIHNCSLINIRYVIVIYVDVRCFNNVCVPFELIVGTIPGHIKSGNVTHSYKSIPNACAVSFNDEQEEVCKITHEVEYLPAYPYLERTSNKDEKELIVEDLT